MIKYFKMQRLTVAQKHQLLADFQQERQQKQQEYLATKME